MIPSVGQIISFYRFLVPKGWLEEGTWLPSENEMSSATNIKCSDEGYALGTHLSNICQDVI